MKNIAFVTGSESNCGIHYYGSNVYEILKISKKYKFHFVEVSNQNEFIEKTINMDAIIYNWHPIPMPWCKTNIFQNVKKPQFLIHGHTANHELIDFSGINEFITIDPNYHKVDKFNSGIRPIIYYPDIKYKFPKQPYKIGTSGIGQGNKNVEVMLQLLNNQFVEPVEFNIHWSVGAFTGADKNLLNTTLDSLKQQAKPNVKINYTLDRLSDYELISWLNNNDINIYIYPNYDAQGVSSSIDKALAAQKPIGVNNSNFFKHIICDEINLEKTAIKDIINKGISPLTKYYKLWNPNTLLEQYERLLDKYYA